MNRSTSRGYTGEMTASAKQPARCMWLLAVVTKRFATLLLRSLRKPTRLGVAVVLFCAITFLSTLEVAGAVKNASITTTADTPRVYSASGTFNTSWDQSETLPPWPQHVIPPTAAPKWSFTIAHDGTFPPFTNAVGQVALKLGGRHLVAPDGGEIAPLSLPSLSTIGKKPVRVKVGRNQRVGAWGAVPHTIGPHSDLYYIKGLLDLSRVGRVLTLATTKLDIQARHGELAEIRKTYRILQNDGSIKLASLKGKKSGFGAPAEGGSKVSFNADAETPYLSFSPGPITIRDNLGGLSGRDRYPEDPPFTHFEISDIPFLGQVPDDPEAPWSQPYYRFGAGSFAAGGEDFEISGEWDELWIGDTTDGPILHSYGILSSGQTSNDPENGSEFVDQFLSDHILGGQVASPDGLSDFFFATALGEGIVAATDGFTKSAEVDAHIGVGPNDEPPPEREFHGGSMGPFFVDWNDMEWTDEVGERFPDGVGPTAVDPVFLADSPVFILDGQAIGSLHVASRQVEIANGGLLLVLESADFSEGSELILQHEAVLDVRGGGFINSVVATQSATISNGSHLAVTSLVTGPGTFRKEGEGVLSVDNITVDGTILDIFAGTFRFRPTVEPSFREVKIDGGTLMMVTPRILVFNDGDDWVLNGNENAMEDGVPEFTGPDELQLTVPGGLGDNQAVSVFLETPQDITQFVLEFDFQVGEGENAEFPADGFALVFQNDPRGAEALGQAGGDRGYGETEGELKDGIRVSFAVLFDIFPGGTPGHEGTGIGFGEDGQISETIPTESLELTDVHVEMTYFMDDLIVGLSERGEIVETLLNVDIPALVGGSSALIGFTAGTGLFNADQRISNFSYRAIGPQRIDMTSTDLTVTDDSLVGVEDQFAPIDWRDLTLSAGVTLTIDAPHASFANVTAGDNATILGDVRVDGTLSPSNRLGMLTIDGDLELGNEAAFLVDLGFDTSDLVAVTGDAELDGQLLVLLIDGLSPESDDLFEILTATSLTGAFDNVADGERLDTAGGEGSFLVTYDGIDNAVLLSEFQLSLLGDLTKNGFVDADDLFVLLANWDTLGGAELGDLFIDEDPAKAGINSDDLFVLLGNWTGPDPNPPVEAALGAAAVPEPSTLVLALLATLGLSFYRRRRRRAA